MKKKLVITISAMLLAPDVSQCAPLCSSGTCKASRSEKGFHTLLFGWTGYAPGIRKGLCRCIGRVVEAVQETDGQLFICADHGNAEMMGMEKPAEMTGQSLLIEKQATP